MMSEKNDQDPPAADLDAVLITDRLARRSSRPPDYEGEARALAALARAMTTAPGAVVQVLADRALELCRADSVVVSILEERPGPPAFRRAAAAGTWARHPGGSTPRDASPCGLALDRDAPLLFDRPGRLFPEAAAVAPELVETLVVPFHVDGRPKGAICANAHSPGREFDAEDARLLTSLARMAAAARQRGDARSPEEVEVEPVEEPARHVGDIAGRDRADEALREREARLRLSLSAGRMGTWTWDAATGVHMRDANLNRLLGLEPVETTRPLSEFLRHHIHPDDRDLVTAAFDASVVHGRPLNVEFRVVRPDGTVRWLKDQGDVFRGREGGPQVAGACVDVTDVKEAEAALRASEERLRLIVEGALDYAILGHKEDETLGRPVDVVFTPEDRAAGVPGHEAETALRDGRAADERWHIREDGSRFFASGVLTPLGEGGSLGFVKVLRDLTDRKQMEDDLRQARDELEARVAERTADLEAEIERRKDLARRLATAQEEERRRVSRDLHDSVGQLLAGLSMTFKAVENAGALPPPVAGKMAEAQAIVDSLGKEVHGLAVRLRPTSLDDVGLGPALAQLMVEWSSRTGVRADFNSEGLGPGRLAPEIETTLYRVVQEALTNVAKHARAGIASVVVSRTEGHVTAVIEDDGVGFHPGSAPKGRLGLVGMNERVALVGGVLGVESETGSGTTIYVRIPIPEGGAGGS
jgi:PAS domain S-box-containing protein